MTSIYLALLTGFAIGLAALFPLALYLRPRYKAAGYSRGYQAGQQQAAERIAALNSDLARHKHIRDIEYQGFQQRTEAIMQDCDERIAVYARRANPFGTADRIILADVLNTLKLAANTFAGLQCNDSAVMARGQMDQLRDMDNRLRTALAAAEPATPEQEAA